ncbi:hypothetical protein [uncultured Streptococcus sp.]|uniref:hypothetical protein n=1 Tax=uncultured Streptococcus sp. TaxID=83427 RepID=UPI0028DC1944|nr:hypothetical protein [uncultured Streptococcus sp.]
MKNNKRKLKRKKKLSRIEKFNLWLESHKLLAFFVDFTVYLVLVGIVSIVLSQVILLPSPYKHMDYMFPLYLNIFLIFGRMYAYYLREICSTKKNLKDYLEPFLYINSFFFIIHLTMGMETRHHTVFPPLLSLDHRYNWFPIATYLVFFTVPALMVLFMKYIETKRNIS